MPEEQKKTERKELLIFLSVAFGLTYLVEVPMLFASNAGDVEPIIMAQMHYPAAGFILAKMICSQDKSMLPKKTFICYLLLTACLTVTGLFSFYMSQEFDISLVFMCLFSIILIITGFLEERKKLKIHGLLGNQWKKSFAILLLFIAVFLFSFFLSFQLLLGISLSKPLYHFAFFPVFFLFGFASLFGEEYGWRVYFQPLLQRKFGLRLGVLVFALLWEVWHLPFILLYVEPQAFSMGLYELLKQVFLMRLVHSSMLAVFMAYAYMKTRNFWLAAMIHGFNNFYTYMIDDGLATSTNPEFTWVTLGIYSVIEIAIFAPFLFSKVFRKPVETTEIGVEAKPEVEVEEKE